MLAGLPDLTAYGLVGAWPGGLFLWDRFWTYPDRGLPALDSGALRKLAGQTGDPKGPRKLLRGPARLVSGQKSRSLQVGQSPLWKSTAVHCSRATLRQTGQEKREDCPLLLFARQAALCPACHLPRDSLTLFCSNLPVAPFVHRKGLEQGGCYILSGEVFRQTLPHKMPLPARESYRGRQGSSCLARQTETPTSGNALQWQGERRSCPDTMFQNRSSSRKGVSGRRRQGNRTSPAQHIL